jgi:signal transduction histidine kinase
VTFEIVDRGIGMTADELERAFTPFWRADGSRTRRTGGVGLGLALARRIARAHGGDVTLRSRPGEGTVAELALQQSATPEQPRLQTKVSP